MVAPLSKPRGEVTKGGQLWDSDLEETSSEEDFDYLKWQLEENKTLDPNTMKLLRGVVQMPFKDRKNPDRYDRNANEEEEKVAMEVEMTKRNQVRPDLFSQKRNKLRDSELEKMKGLSKAD